MSTPAPDIPNATKAYTADLIGTEYEQLNAIFPSLCELFETFLRDKYELGEDIISRTRRMFEYTTLGGKCNRAIMCIYAVEDLCKHKGVEYDEELRRKALVLAWCVEILQAEFLVMDDIMDKSTTRRGKPCWYQIPEIGFDAANDGMVLDSFLYFLLEKTFGDGDKGLYVKIIQLFWDVSLRTKMGQMMDLVSQPQGREAPPNMLEGFNLTLYQRIVRFKTAYYTFYLPLASAMLICGFDSDAQLKIANSICVQLGEKFQIQDDYLDCYGDEALIGKRGTDIFDHKCSWLVVQFMKVATKEQMEELRENYGKHDEEKEAKVKALYEAVGMREMYAKQEDESYKELVQKMEDAKDQVPPFLFERILKKIHNRQK